MHLFLKARAEADIAKHGPHARREPRSAAEWFWMWLASGSRKKSAGVFPHHTKPFIKYVLPRLDERSLHDLTPQYVADLLNGVPTLEEMDDAERVLACALGSACDEGWLAQNVTAQVRLVATLDVVFDEDDPYLLPLVDPGLAEVLSGEK